MSFSMMIRTILMLCVISTADAGYCAQAYDCTCYKQDLYYVSCGFFGWGSCAKYRVGTKTCTCYKDVCCPGYNGTNCNTPLCFGTTGCPNGGTCLSPDKCKCASGYAEPYCTDINECLKNTSNCEQICSNTPGSYSCFCKKGYALDINGSSCNDVDECKTDNGGCEHNCFNAVGSFNCSCNDGHVLHDDSLSCNDENECETDNGGCQQICVNAEPFYNCSCGEGYILLNDSTSCGDVDECNIENGGCAHNCSNEIGSFKCSCDGGYVLHNDSLSCIDENECETGSHRCHHSCVNAEPFYNCSCNDGYVLLNDSQSCNDVNECDIDNGGCEQHCSNKNGTFSCECTTGFLLNNDSISCDDVNECKTKRSLCDHTCTNTVGSFYCSCLENFSLLDDDSTCDCLGGYSLSSDNATCNDIDECENENGHCEQHCKNKDGSFTCVCVSGYFLQNDGRSCLDIDECSVNNGGCQQQCLNVKGSFSCSCGIGFTLGDDGLSCENITGRSFSLSLIILIDSESTGHLPFLVVNSTYVSDDKKIFKTIRNLIQTHLKNYTSSSFKVFVQNIRILPDVYPNQNNILQVEVGLTVIYENNEKGYIEVRDGLVRGTSDLSDWTAVSFNGTTAQAKLDMAENISSVCDLYKNLVGDCDRGFQCTGSSNGPICRKMETPGDTKNTDNPIVYTLPVLAVVAVIVFVAIAIKFIRDRRFNYLTHLSVKFRQNGSLAHVEVVENEYENPLADAAVSNIEATGAATEGKGSKKEVTGSKNEATESKKEDLGTRYESTESNDEGYYESLACQMDLEDDPNLVYSLIKEEEQE